MRVLTLAVTGVLILALAMPASAIVLTDPSYAGPITINIQDFDTGTLYNVADNPVGSPYIGSALLDTFSQTNDPNGPTLADGSKSNTWGLLRIVTITEANGSGKILWSTSPGDEIDGVFWGLDDQYLNQVTTGAQVTQEIRGTGLHFAMFESGSAWPGGVPGPAAANPNGEAPGVPTYPGITSSSKLLWTFNAVPGFSLADINAGLGNSFFATVTNNASVYQSFGDMNANLGAVPGYGTGPANNLFVTGKVPAYKAGDVAGDPTAFTDIAFHFTATSSFGQNANWLLYSSDPMSAVGFVPEPITMTGLFIGMVGLGGYVRRRKAAK
jgi:hypothetical protein